MIDVEPSRRFSLRLLLILLAVCAASRFVFILVQGYIARLLVSALSALGVSSSTGVGAVIASMSVLGALIAAVILCFPLGLSAPKHPALLGAIVGLVGGMGMAWTWLSLPEESGVLLGLRWLELAAFVGGCVLSSIAAAKRVRRVAA